MLGGSERKSNLKAIRGKIQWKRTSYQNNGIKFSTTEKRLEIYIFTALIYHNCLVEAIVDFPMIPSTVSINLDSHLLPVSIVLVASSASPAHKYPLKICNKGNMGSAFIVFAHCWRNPTSSVLPA